MNCVLGVFVCVCLCVSLPVSCVCVRGKGEREKVGKGRSRGEGRRKGREDGGGQRITFSAILRNAIHPRVWRQRLSLASKLQRSTSLPLFSTGIESIHHHDWNSYVISGDGIYS